MRGFLFFELLILLTTSTALAGGRRGSYYGSPHVYSYSPYHAPESPRPVVDDTPKFEPWRNHHELWVWTLGNERRLYYFPNGIRPSESTQLMIKPDGCLVDKDLNPLGGVVPRQAQDFMVEAYEKISNPSSNVRNFIRRREAVRDFEKSQMGAQIGMYEYRKELARTRHLKKIIHQIEEAKLSDTFKQVIAGLTQNSDNARKSAVVDLEHALRKQDVFVSRRDIEDLGKLALRGEIHQMKLCAWAPDVAKRMDVLDWLNAALSSQGYLINSYRRQIQCEIGPRYVSCRD